jgi:hypothetical protein
MCVMILVIVQLLFCKVSADDLSTALKNVAGVYKTPPAGFKYNLNKTVLATAGYVFEGALVWFCVSYGRHSY